MNPVAFLADGPYYYGPSAWIDVQSAPRFFFPCVCGWGGRAREEGWDGLEGGVKSREGGVTPEKCGRAWGKQPTLTSAKL